MTQTIKLYDIYHADLFSRAKAAQLADYISPDADIVVLDFGGITFMSRSFTDELYNTVIAYPHKTFTYTGRNDDIRVMMEKVVDGRTRERKLGIPPAQMLSFDSPSKLSDFLVVQ